MKNTAALLSCLLAGWLAEARPATSPPHRPNILWLTAEDLSPHLGCYGDPDARTPVLDGLANRGVRHTHAFATAPVCSPARSTLITGLYATTLGTQRLRSQFPVRPGIRGFSAWLREAGYHCSNNVKTDYNLRDETAFIADAWDESSPNAHWRNRKPGQPFFAVFNFMTTHQSRTSVWSHEEFEREIGSKLSPGERHDPATVRLPPFYPDTPEARRAWARYHDCITLMDREAGELLAQLEADGLADNTIVFFYGDHGMGMPRGKRVLHDSGMRVPLIISFPEAWRHLAPAPAGDTSDRLVSFVDFAPTVLSLAGVPLPDHLQGTAFLGPAAGPPRSHVYGARDRVDEVFDLSRSVRDDRWLYIRNYLPHLSWMQPERYSDASTFRQELVRLAAAGRLGPGPLTYAAPRRALEELYDTHADPHQLTNLADHPDHQDRLDILRAELRQWLRDSRDVGFLTEPQVWDRLGPDRTPQDLGRDPARYPLERLIDAAELVGRPDAWQQQLQQLRDEGDGVRYWAAVGLHAAALAGNLRDPAARPALLERLDDPSPVVRLELAAALLALGPADEALAVLAAALEHPVPEVVLHAARTAELLGHRARPLLPVLRQTLDRARRDEHLGDLPMFIRFSLEAALDAPWAKAGDIRVVAEHVPNEAATPAFRFPTVPPPSTNDAATHATVTVIDGRPDSNSGGPDVLRAGRVPVHEDQPAENFFFAAGTDGGRLLVDLGRPILIRQINSYSWHADTRSPQVYTLYASDGTAPEFVAEPKRDTDPEGCGWTKIAVVDTRPISQTAGGQHGVSLSAAEGPLGTFRHLLLDVRRTGLHAAFDNTFFSEFDVLDFDTVPVPVAAETPESVTRTFATGDGQYRFTVDLSVAPDLAGWVDTRLRPVVQEWYPRLVEMLPSDGWQPIAHVTLRFRNDMGGTPASAGGGRVNLNAAWFRRELDREALGAVVHELVHVVQAYGRVRRDDPRATRMPGWLVEGIADYIRWFLYEPETRGAEITARNLPRARYDASYRISGNFLDWVTREHDPDIVRKLNAAARAGRYHEDLWREYTGSTVQELGEAWRAWHERRLAEPES